MISNTERQKAIAHYKSMLHDFPNSDRREHWQTLLDALEQEARP